MSNLRALIAYFIINSPKNLLKTEIIKYIYYFEYLRVQKLGEQLTDINFIRYNYGPYSSTIEKSINSLEIEGFIYIDIFPNSYGNLSYIHKVSDEKKLKNIINLSQQDEKIARETIKILSPLKFKDMIDKVYETPPMNKLLSIEDNENESLIGRRLDMGNKKKNKNINKKRLKEAKKRFDKSTRGNRKDRAQELININKELSEARRRANNCLLRK